MKIIILSGFFLALVFITGFAQVDKPCCSNPFPKTITVTGSASMEVTPDQIFVEVYLREYKKKGEDKTPLDKIKSGFLTLCKNANIADSNIVVSDYEGFNNYFYFRRGKKQNPDLFSAIRYVIRFNEMAKVNSLADGLDDEAVQRFDIINVTHSKISEFRKQLKISAVKAAKEKAVYLTEAINEKLGEAISVKEPNDTESDAVLKNRSAVSNQAVYNQGRDNNKTEAYMFDQINSINYKKIKFRFEVEILFALK
jgi:uncharacterized protein YggE